MQIPSGMATVALADGLAAVSGVWLLVSSARRRHGLRSQAHRVLAVGGVLAVSSAIIGLAEVLALVGQWDQHLSQRTVLARVVAVGVAVGAIVLCAGLLWLPGVAATPAVAVRLVLDGLVVAAGLWFVGLVLVSEPTQLLGAATPTRGGGIIVVSVAAAVVIGSALVVGLRSAQPRYGVACAVFGVGAVAVGGLILVVGLSRAGAGAALAGAGLLALGLLVVAVAGRKTDAIGETEADVTRQATGLAFLPMFAMVVSAIYHLMRGGAFNVLALVASSAEGFALVAGQYLALRDVRGYAGRLAEREAHFRELAHTDPLTGLANRRGLLRILHNESGPDNPCVLLGLDLDGFKHVNDMRGHDVGDAVLVEVGHRLRTNLRPGDLAARLGGDEFAVLMWGRPAEAQRVAERLLGVLGRPYERPEGRIFLSASIGLATNPEATDVEALLRNADLALRYAKQRGKNRVERYDVAYDRLLRRRTTLEHELRGAIDRDELRLAFQPVVAVPSVRPVGAEALLRWHHPELGRVGPDEFIPVAEECGMIAKLGAWVLHQACHQLSLWLADGHDVWLSVNVSPRELHAPEYVVQVAEALRAHRVPPQRLVLEVTEHAVATDLDELVRRLTALRLTGVRIALDDFGAGYSSLGQLRRLPIDILKIDHSLVSEPETAPSVRREGRAVAPMVDVVMRLGHQLGLEVIAEGVTNPSELAAVVEAGCRFGQGQLFGWGVPAEHLEAMLDAATSPGAKALASPTVSATASPAVSATVSPVSNAATTMTPAGATSASSGAVPTQSGPAGSTASASAATASDDRLDQEPTAQDVRSVDSSREMRQA